MPRFLVQVSYSTQGMATMVGHPMDRETAIRQLVEKAGGQLESFDFCFGDYDAVAIAEMPDNVSMAALSIAVSASGATSEFKTTALLSSEEAMEAMQKAASYQYRPPGPQRRT